MKIIRKILCLLFLSLTLLIVFAFIYYFSITKSVALHPEKLVLNDQAILLYDASGQEIKDVSLPHTKETFHISELNPLAKQAFIDVEDKRFYSHHGFDFKRILGASLRNIKAHSFKEGASTISQQLIKNTHLTQEKTLKRKLQEWKLTKQLENAYSKDEILEKYLNSIYFGHNCFGLTAASKFYFSKNPQELSLSDAALLAGLVKSPNNYSPFRHPERCAKRKSLVLRLMEDNGSITKEERQSAMSEPLPIQNNSYFCNDYAQFVFEELSDISTTQTFHLGGKVEIYSYLEPHLQAKLIELSKQHTDSDKAFFVLDNENLAFKACISSIGNARRLPGSLIKPLLVYSPAFEEDILSPATPILDEKINYNGYTPENYDGKYHGYVSTRECIEQSLNIPAVKVLESVGISHAVQYMQRLNLEVPKEDESLALALGGMKLGYSLKDLTAAYATFANEGEFSVGRFIDKIKINGKIVYQRKPYKEKVFSSETNYLMRDILRTTAKNGTAKKLRSLPFDIAAKTGTVGTSNGNTDAYAISLTSKDSISVWLGNANNEKIAYTGGGLPCNYLLEINEYLYEYYQSNSDKISNFNHNEKVANIPLDKYYYQSMHTLLQADINAPQEYKFYELFKASSIPQNKSTAFSFPTIQQPTLRIDDHCVTIELPTHAPPYYQYKILRKNMISGESQLLYNGTIKSHFTDKKLDENAVYIYTIIPFYKNNNGQALTLPSVSTKNNSPTIDNSHILDKSWWDY